VTQTQILPAGPAASCAASCDVGVELAEVKPQLRGWLHAGTAPLTLVGGVLLVLLSPAGAARVGCAVFATSAVTLFTVSATMHRGRWSPRTARLLTRMDHAGIFLLIAGTYTPYAVMLLPGRDRVVLLVVAWVGAAGGIAFRMLRPQAARWVYTPLYLALGWLAVAYAPEFGRAAGPVVLVLVASGGLLYTVGAVVYGLRRPNPVPQWFGFHEVFHAFTVLAFAAHYAGVTLAATHLA
jgi:hemolysin III